MRIKIDVKIPDGEYCDKGHYKRKCTYIQTILSTWCFLFVNELKFNNEISAHKKCTPCLERGEDD